MAQALHHGSTTPLTRAMGVCMERRVLASSRGKGTTKVVREVQLWDAAAAAMDSGSRGYLLS